MTVRRQASVLDAAALSKWPFPEHGPAADKEERGQVLVIAGSAEVPGAALLAAVAALRAGAGKLLIAAPQSIALGLALAIPEARVIALAQTRSGRIEVERTKALEAAAGNVRAVVIGPGMVDQTSSLQLTESALPMFRHCTVILDAFAMSAVLDGPLEQPAIVTPHAGEMAFLSGQSKAKVCAEPLAAATAAAELWNTCVVLKGATTYIVQPEGAAWQHEAAMPGLATSGSGDTLAGLIGGLAARGMAPVAAAAWGVTLHAQAGRVLAERHGTLGYLARELSGEVPALLHAASQQPLRVRKSRIG